MRPQDSRRANCRNWGEGGSQPPETSPKAKKQNSKALGRQGPKAKACRPGSQNLAAGQGQKVCIRSTRSWGLANGREAMQIPRSKKKTERLRPTAQVGQNLAVGQVPPPKARAGGPMFLRGAENLVWDGLVLPRWTIFSQARSPPPQPFEARGARGE